MPLNFINKMNAHYLLKMDDTPICSVLYKEDNPELIKYLIEQNAEIHYHFFPSVYGYSPTEFRPLSIAAIYERYYSLLVLLNAGAEVNLQTKKNNCGLLLEILQRKKPIANIDSVIRLFLHFGADPDAANGVNGENGTFYEFLRKQEQQSELYWLTNIHSRIQQIQAHKETLQNLLGSGKYKQQIEQCEAIVSLYEQDVREENNSPFKQHYVTQAIYYLSQAAQYTEDIANFTKFILAIEKLSLKLKGDEFFHPELQRTLSCIHLKLKNFGENNTEQFAQCYSAFASICEILGKIEEKCDFSQKAAKLLIPEEKKPVEDSDLSNGSDNSEETPLLGEKFRFHPSPSRKNELTHRTPHSQRDPSRATLF